MQVAPRVGVQAAIALALLAAIFGFSYLTGTGAIMAAGGPSGTLVAFGSDEELGAFLRQLRARRDKETWETMAYSSADIEMGAAQGTIAGMPAAIDPAITNVQEAGVDEGGIVKVRGDVLVILRRGRLFTVSLAGGGMRAIDRIDAFPPGAAAQGDWYDEMLLAGDRVIVIGYSYARGGTEINRFKLGGDGRLAFEDSHQLRSSDYYSSRNYASRLIGDKLILYAPLYLAWENDPFESLPALRRWRGQEDDGGFDRIAASRQVYIPLVMRNDAKAAIDTVHSVTTCNLGAATLDCAATAVLGPGSRSFYVSGEAVYLWLSDFTRSSAGSQARTSYIYRLPLGDERPSAVRARGAPTDQFSFRADETAGTLNVLLRPEGDDWMFSPEASSGDVMLLSAPLSAFGDGSRELDDSYYRRLPRPPAKAGGSITASSATMSSTGRERRTRGNCASSRPSMLPRSNPRAPTGSSCPTRWTESR